MAWQACRPQCRSHAQAGGRRAAAHVKNNGQVTPSVYRTPLTPARATRVPWGFSVILERLLVQTGSQRQQAC